MTFASSSVRKCLLSSRYYAMSLGRRRYLENGGIHLVATIDDHNDDDVVDRQSVRELGQVLDVVRDASKRVVQLLERFVVHGDGNDHLGLLASRENVDSVLGVVEARDVAEEGTVVHVLAHRLPRLSREQALDLLRPRGALSVSLWNVYTLRMKGEKRRDVGERFIVRSQGFLETWGFY